MIDHICELCGKPFKAKLHVTRFCSKKCSNTYNSRQKPRLKATPCKKCGAHGYGRDFVCTACIKKCSPQELRQHNIRQGSRIWTSEEEQYLRKHYPHKGAKQVAKELGTKTYKQVLDKANKMKLCLNDEAYRHVVHDKAKEFMLSDNPMKRPSVRKKIAEWCRAHPEKMIPLVRSQQKIMKGRPTKLEFKLQEILTGLGVGFQPQFFIKPKFIVDVKVGNLIIQADGDYWHGHPRFEPLTERQLKQQQRDRAQDAYLEACGYTVVRIWESDMDLPLVKRILDDHGISMT